LGRPSLRKEILGQIEEKGLGGAILEGVNPGGGFQEQGLRKPGNLEKETCHQKYWKRPRRMYPRFGLEDSIQDAWSVTSKACGHSGARGSSGRPLELSGDTVLPVHPERWIYSGRLFFRSQCLAYPSSTHEPWGYMQGILNTADFTNLCRTLPPYETQAAVNHLSKIFWGWVAYEYTHTI
jgi:hypothetical protein